MIALLVFINVGSIGKLKDIDKRHIYVLIERVSF